MINVFFVRFVEQCHVVQLSYVAQEWRQWSIRLERTVDWTIWTSL